MYLDQRLDLMLFDRKSTAASYGGGAGSVGGGGSDDRFGGRDNFQSPPYEYGGGGEFRGEGGYGNGMRKTRSYGDMSESVGRGEEKRVVSVTPLRDMTPERVFGKMGHLQKLLDRFLACSS